MGRKNLGMILCAMILGFVVPEVRASDQIPWGLVAHSDLIVVGKLTGYSKSIRKADGQLDEGHADIDVSKVLKGSYPVGPLHTHYGISDDLMPVLAQDNGRYVIAFLIGGFDRYEHRLAYQLYEPDGAGVVVLDSEQAEASILTELDREKHQVTTMAALLDNQAGEIRERVDAATDKLTGFFEFRRNQGIQELVKVGCRGLPFLVSHLRDRRKVGGIMQIPGWQSDWIMSSDDFDRVGPKDVGDVVPYLLLWITSTGMPPRDEKDMDDALRQKQYEYWLVYLANHIYQHDPEDFGEWNDQCAGAIW